MASIRRWFTSICIDQTLPRCNVHQTTSEWRGWRRSTLFDIYLMWIDTWLIINRCFGWLRLLQTTLIVDLHQFTSTSCSTLNQPILGLNRRKSTFGRDRDRPGSTGRRSGVDQRRSGVDWRRFASIKIDLGIINVDLSYYTLINPNQLISRYFYAI